ncbi:TadE/TadG family type IV pilus assembly protein [Paramicrobacterium agarici]|uniref:TadE-like protein n=1 Tax=Paramicrobacterium agarici TaxID=630514 RepID=A0A2A9DT74_9MICO|nr:TadE/TadG family type IV pilus assembly protein [Microbacterium agarici]PFG29556.1 TadE-like protein [Microbacterium agarici]
MIDLRSERGSAAVEFALVVPILIALLLGILEFGSAYSAQVSVTAAARDGARTMSVTADPAAARQSVRASAPGFSPQISSSQIAITNSSGGVMSSCPPGQTVTVTITYPYTYYTGFFGPGFSMTGKAAMRCGG